MHYRLCGLEMGHISRCIMNVFAASYDISKASLEGQESTFEGLGHMSLSCRPLPLCLAL